MGSAFVSKTDCSDLFFCGCAGCKSSAQAVAVWHHCIRAAARKCWTHSKPSLRTVQPAGQTERNKINNVTEWLAYCTFKAKLAADALCCLQIDCSISGAACEQQAAEENVACLNTPFIPCHIAHCLLSYRMLQDNLHHIFALCYLAVTMCYIAC